MKYQTYGSAPITGTSYIKTGPTYDIDTLDLQALDLEFKVSIRTKFDEDRNKIITIKLSDISAGKTFKHSFDKNNTNTYDWFITCLTYYESSANWISQSINRNVLEYLKGNWLSGKFLVIVNQNIAQNMSHAERLYDSITNNNEQRKQSLVSKYGRII